MPVIGVAKALYRRWRHRRQEDADLDEEVRAYFDVLVERFEAQGLTTKEARRAARLHFEGPEQVKQKVRETRMGASLETALQDLHYAWRSLLKSPGFTTVAVLTLAVGIGANTAIFSLINAVMLRSLPVEAPERLALLTDPSEAGVDMDTTQRGLRTMLSYPEFQELRVRNTVFSGLFAAQSSARTLEIFPAGAAQSLAARTQLVSGEFFGVLGIQPVLGRTFTPEEDQARGRNPVAVVAYDFWQRELGARADVLHTTIRVGRGVFQVVGVAPPGFRGIVVGSDTDIWFPITMQQQVLPGWDYLTPRDTLWLQVMGRLAPGVSMKAAQDGINAALQQMLQAWQPGKNTSQEHIELKSGARGASELRGQFSDPLVLLMAMVGLVLLIACANIANLMLARASGRRREIGVRLALGASRIRLIRQLLTESLLVAAFACLAGILLSVAGTRVLMALVSAGAGDLGLTVPRDLRVLGFTAGISLATGILFGLVPALRATRVDVNQTLATNVRGSVGGRGSVRSGRILAVAQIALSLVALIGAALFVRSLRNMLSQDLGFEHHRILSIQVDPAAAGYKGATASALYERVRRDLGRIPGVRAVTLSNIGLFKGDSGDQLDIEGTPVHNRDRLDSSWTEVGADYFKTLRIPLLLGREIDSSDAERATQVCVINEAFAREFYPGVNPIGRHITDLYPTTIETFEIVGIAANAREHHPREAFKPRFYSNLAHPIGAVNGVTFLLSASGDAEAVAASARHSIRQVDPALPVLRVETIDEALNRRLTTANMLARLATFFGFIAVFMAAVGLSGVISYSIARRTSEIGIRMALGASRLGVLRMVLSEALTMVVVGLAIGLPCALASGRFVATRLFGLKPSDPTSIAAAICVILVMALLGAYIPARRASRIDPAISLRQE